MRPRLHAPTTLVALVALLLAGQTTAEPQPGGATAIIQAARFLQPTALDAYFSHWSRIVADARSAHPIAPLPGDDGFVRALAGRHSMATRLATGGGRPWWVHQQWGWSFLDLDWELEIGSGQAVLAFREGFDPRPLLDRLDERGYRRDDHHGQTTWHHAFDPSLPWLRPPLAAFQNVAYLEGDGIMLLATQTEALQAMLDAQAGRSAAWPGGAVTEVFGHATEPPMAAMLFMASSVCGLAPEQEAQLQPFQAAALGYRREGDALLGTVIIGYADEAAASLDLRARSHITDQGRDRSGALYSERHFELLGGETVGDVLLLHLGSLATPGRLFDLLLRMDAGFLDCPAGGG